MKKLVVIIGLLILPLIAYAHGGGREVKGTIQKTSKDSIQMKTTAGKVETFTLTARTKFTKGKEQGSASDMRIGSRAIVHLAKDGRLVLEVQLPAEKVGRLEGRILSRDLKKNELTVAHGEIQGIMKAMTMAFHVHDAKVSTLPGNGTRIRAKLHASGGNYWLTEVRAVP